MKKLALALLLVGLWGLSAADSQAQVVYTTYYAPAVPTVVAQPVTVYRPAPVVYTSYYAAPPVAVAPAPVYYAPATRVRTRFRPILGGTVTRIRPAYRSYYAPMPVVYGY